MEIHQRPANRKNTGHFGAGVSSKNNRSEPPASRTAMTQSTKESRDEIATILTRSIHNVTSWALPKKPTPFYDSRWYLMKSGHSTQNPWAAAINECNRDVTTTILS